MYATFAVQLGNMPVDGKKRVYIQNAIKRTNGRFLSNLVEDDAEQRVDLGWASGMDYARFCILERIIKQRFF